ncbi:hypothetical protein [Roseicyclus persicicus]|uniref:Uncharacterized protein n=1 Tax=Roseicyclus persicicus TaxID=2650661 RepID=A0A7X6GX60_9RHOB|nr:hypothetical protein [Roseibacterium persicicum]NKX44046.1 hypothetical protein [Roseibacterium persicicum]
MSTTTDRAPILRRILLALPLVAVGWIGTLALVLRLGGEAPGVFVPFPPADLLARLPGDIAVTGSSPVSVTLAGAGPGLVAAVYGAGAWLVLPAGLEACIPGFLRETPP